MSYTMERLNNPPVYVVTFNSDFDASTDLAAYFKDLIVALDEEQEPISIIVDVLQYELSFNELLAATKDLLALNINPYQHPYSKQLILVTDNKMVKMSMDGFRKFGLVKKFLLTTTLNEALGIAHTDRYTASNF